MNASYLNLPEVQSGIRRAWSHASQLPFYGKLRRCVKFYKDFCLQKAANSKAQELHLRQCLERSTVSLQQDPRNPQVQGDLAEAASRLLNFEKTKAEGQRLRSRLKWKSQGDRCSREFFQANKERSTASHITELQDEHGVVHTQQEELERIGQSYYRKLYTARAETNNGAVTQVLSYLSDKILPQMKDSLKASLFLGELHTAMMAMMAGKSPGPDGVVL